MNEWGKVTKRYLDEYTQFILKDTLVHTEDEKELEKQEMVIKAMSERLFEDVKQDIKGLESKHIVEQSEKELKTKEQSRQVARVKMLLIEGVVLGFIIGLIVNQITELVAFLKGQGSINVNATTWCVFGLLICALIFGFVIYLNKLEEYFYKKEVKKNGS